MGSTGQPAIIYLPGGTYLLENGLQLYIGTVIVGDPKNPPVLKAKNNFATDHIVYAKDPNFGGTINFYIGIKNVVIDSTGVDPNRRMVLLDWTVSQATQLTNVVFRMPQGAEGHVGMTTEFDYNSNIILVSPCALSKRMAVLTEVERSHLPRRKYRYEPGWSAMGVQGFAVPRHEDRRCHRRH